MLGALHQVWLQARESEFIKKKCGSAGVALAVQLASFQHGVSQKPIEVRRASTGELFIDRKLVSFSANQVHGLLAADIAVEAC